MNDIKMLKGQMSRLSLDREITVVAGASSRSTGQDAPATSLHKIRQLFIERP